MHNIAQDRDVLLAICGHAVFLSSAPPFHRLNAVAALCRSECVSRQLVQLHAVAEKPKQLLVHIKRPLAHAFHGRVAAQHLEIEAVPVEGDHTRKALELGDEFFRIFLVPAPEAVVLVPRHGNGQPERADVSPATLDLVRESQCFNVQVNFLIEQARRIRLLEWRLDPGSRSRHLASRANLVDNTMPARRSERYRADCRHSRIIVGRLTSHMLKNLFQGLRRIFPGCVMLGQAIAFSMFLAFFPMLLFALGVLANTPFLHTALREIPERLRLILPPGSADVVSAYFVRKVAHPRKWMALGLGGTLIAGSQVMLGFMEGFRIIHGETSHPSYWRTHVRALVLLCVTIVPMLPVVVLTVFGRQARATLVQRTGLPHLIHNVEFVFYATIVFVLAMVVLVALYRIGRPGHEAYRNLLPGAAVATVLWWATEIIFGFYVRKMPYDVVYGGLAAAIGLLVWMYLTAMIVFLGAAYNVAAHSSAARGGSRVRGR